MRSINDGFTKEEMSVTQRRGVITCIPKEDKPKKYLKKLAPNNASEHGIQNCISVYRKQSENSFAKDYT